MDIQKELYDKNEEEVKVSSEEQCGAEEKLAKLNLRHDNPTPNEDDESQRVDKQIENPGFLTPNGCAEARQVGEKMPKTVTDYLATPSDDPEVPKEAKKKPKKSVRFNDTIEEELVEYYDRSGMLTVNMSPVEKIEVRMELNIYKQTEMVVHEKSHGNTRYHSLG